MKCNYCGSDMQEMDSVCPFCGTPAGAASPVERRESGVSEGGGMPSGESVSGEGAGGSAERSVSDEESGMPMNESGSGEETRMSIGESGSGEGTRMSSGEGGVSEGAGVMATKDNSGEGAGVLAAEGGWKEGTGAGGTDGGAGFTADSGMGMTPKKKSGGKVAVIAACAAAVIGLGVFGAARLMEKDPKEVVIAAFENVYTEDQVKPMEELFGVSKFQENTANSSEASFQIVLDRSSDEEINQAAGAGIRTGGKYDREQKKISGNLGILFNNMDLVNLNIYYGDETVMASIPELSGKVFTLDLREGLAERLENSPILGPAVASSDMDVKGLEQFFREYADWIEKKAGDARAGDPYGLREVWNRYQDGCEAQENFKAALTVEKAEKATFQIDGKEENCKGYQVHVSKEDMISFLRTSSDFFLQDPELKENFLENLKISMRLLELTGEMEFSAMEGKTAEDVLDENYEEAKAFVDDAIEQLDKSLNDVEMLVHVDKKGRLASVQGTTSITNEEEELAIAFDLKLQGGSYLTQNATAKVEATDGTQTAVFELIKSGTYDGKELTGDLSFDCSVNEENLYFLISGTYQAEGGDFTLQGEVGADGQKMIGVSTAGIVSELEKGTTLHMDLDEIRLDVPADTMDSGFLMGEEEDFFLVFSGEYDLRPLSGAIEELSGEKLDVIEATEEDWQRVMMEAYMGAMDIMNQLGPVLNGN